jgi:thiol:disulfide interchange protein DsbA
MRNLFAALMLLASTSLMAEPMAGIEFNTVAQTIPTEDTSKVEVIELFWYGCGHCNSLEPQLHAWANKLPADVVFKRVPGLPRADWAPMAKAYYAMESLGVLDKLHDKIFAAIHKQRTLNPTDEKAAINWIAKEGGLDQAKVEEASRPTPS